MRVLLLPPPMSQLNTPYPATPYLTGFLDKHAARLGLEVAQEDLALSLFLALFTRTWFSHAADLLRARYAATPRKRRDQVPPSVDHFLLHAERYIDTVEPVIRFLQGRDPSLALRIVGRELLPEGPRWDPVREHDRDEEGLRWAFGAMGTQDQARYLASLYIDDLADTIKDGLDDRFELARYGEGLAASAASFDTMQAALTRTPSPVDEALDELGIKGAETDTSYGLWAPAGTPQPIIARLANELSKILQQPDVVERYRKSGAPVIAEGPAAFKARIAREVSMYKEIVQKAGLKVE